MAGKYYDDLEVGALIEHAVGRTITETDNILFSAMTMNPQPLHLNEDYAAQTRFGTRIVNGLFTLGLAVGLTVHDLTEGTLIANLGYDTVRHPLPVFHGDTLYVRSEVLEKRPSRSDPRNGIVRLRHEARNQKGEVVLTFERSCLMQRRPTE
ncbi:MAG: MaoC family dehydratase [Thermoflexales bacterium]|nr:MaoC family dehydratase [Thermoflexales bacterium]